MLSVHNNKSNSNNNTNSTLSAILDVANSLSGLSKGNNNNKHHNNNISIPSASPIPININGNNNNNNSLASSLANNPYLSYQNILSALQCPSTFPAPISTPSL